MKICQKFQAKESAGRSVNACWHYSHKLQHYSTQIAKSYTSTCQYHCVTAQLEFIFVWHVSLMNINFVDKTKIITDVSQILNPVKQTTFVNWALLPTTFTTWQFDYKHTMSVFHLPSLTKIPHENSLVFATSMRTSNGNIHVTRSNVQD